MTIPFVHREYISVILFLLLTSIIIFFYWMNCAVNSRNDCPDISSVCDQLKCPYTYAVTQCLKGVCITFEEGTILLSNDYTGLICKCVKIGYGNIDYCKGYISPTGVCVVTKTLFT